MSVNPPKVELLRTISKFRKREEISSSLVYFLCKGVFTWENSHRREFHTDMTFWFRIAFTWCQSYFTSRYLKVHFMLTKCTCDSKSRTLRMRYPFQSTGRPISHRNGWSFRVYMIPLRDFVPEWNSRPGTRTGVTRASMKFVVVSCKQI